MAQETQYAILMYSFGTTYSTEMLNICIWDIAREPHTRVDRGLGDVADGSALDHVPHGEALDGLVLRNAARAVRAADEADVATALLVAAAISSLFRLQEGQISASAAQGHPSQRHRIQPIQRLLDLQIVLEQGVCGPRGISGVKYTYHDE